MDKPLTSKKKADSFSWGIFLIGIGILYFSGSWWPGIMLVIGIPVALKQFLLARIHDAIITLIVFIGTYAIEAYNLRWNVFVPVILMVGGLYIILKEFFNTKESEIEKEEDLNKEIEEKDKK